MVGGLKNLSLGWSGASHEARPMELKVPESRRFAGVEKP